MRRITVLVVFLLLVVTTASASDAKKPTASKPSEPVVKLSAEEIFKFVERVQNDPKADRAQARAFLQDVLDGQVRLYRTEEVIVGTKECITANCQGKGCMKCDQHRHCVCSLCCVALHQ